MDNFKDALPVANVKIPICVYGTLARVLDTQCKGVNEAYWCNNIVQHKL